jgi:hypothetical protein
MVLQVGSDARLLSVAMTDYLELWAFFPSFLIFFSLTHLD